MTFFSRRRIQSMICELNAHLTEEKRKDITQRLNSKDSEQCLGAEAELAIFWCLRKIDLDVDPFWWREGRSPDGYVEGFLPGQPTAIEVTAFADAAISGESQMDHCSNKIVKIADEELRGAGQYLYFHFAETRHYDRGRSVRSIAAPKDYVPSEATVRKIRDWIRSSPIPKARMRIEDSGLIVELEKRDSKQLRYHNYHTSRPPRTYSNTRNPLYRRLSDKAKQLALAPVGVSRIIFLVEAGSRFLAELGGRQHNYLEGYSRPHHIIQKFIDDKKGKLDAVVVLVPVVEQSFGSFGQFRPKRYWSARIFSSEDRNPASLTAAVDGITEQLPPPRFNGCNARSLVRQKAMQHDARGWYLGANYTMFNDEITYRMSSRAFQDFLANRINESQFRHSIGSSEDEPIIAGFLQQGYTIKDAMFEPGGIDEDDDHIVLKFAKDPAAMTFK
ncbi:MAG: hypothetical protein KBT70_04365 [Roseovarius sp.]|uniref:hypothetical protein n=1 Tax=Roseovarius sp. TaxID=1486281 RepID=UPI001B6EB178|nr:hypothetical protein [Roseovarius sp.]MBQ0749414.1 hypothetical protein [Roseovarius sp.]MBQ0809920.1 hypothetical protein [Roseovarius sp.]